VTRQSLTKDDAAAADGSAAPAGGTAPGENFGGVLAIIGVITSQLALITALLYYFGWVRTSSFLSYFGIDPRMAGYGTADYVLRSIRVAFPPFICAAVITLMLFGVHRLIVGATLDRGAVPGFTAPSTAADSVTSLTASHPGQPAGRRIIHRASTLACQRPSPRGMRWCLNAVHATGAALVVVVFIGVLLPGQIGVPLGLVLPLLLIAAVSVLGYVAYLRSTYPATLTLPGSRPAAPIPRAYTLTLIALGLVAALWAVGLYGDQIGVGVATDFADYLPDQPSVMIYSTERIAVAGPGVVAAEITQPGTKYHYQYSGLRLLLHAPDKYLVLPVGWRHGRDQVFVLRDDDTIRVDITTR
jgi:hypothetical protein